MGWKESKIYQDTFTSTKAFNGCKYVVAVSIEFLTKSTRFWISATSGKKRSQMKDFEHKRDKSVGGMEALFWVKNEMLLFPDFYKENFTADEPLHICIEWADNRRRNIYERLRKDGFYFMQINGKKILIKNI